MISGLSELETSNMAMAVRLSPYANDVLRVLMIAYPNSISGDSLLIYLGADLNDQSLRFSKFVTLTNLRLFINEKIGEFGFMIDRTNGTPKARFFLRRI